MTVLLALNCGSSSLKYATFHGDDALVRGAIERIGAGGVPDHGAAVHAVLDRLAEGGGAPPCAVGHRIVHGGPDHTTPARVDDALLASLERAVPFAPLHLPAELAAIRAVRERFGDVPQVVCFDTTFHRTLPPVAQRLPVPASLHTAGVRRYGFHGLSYEYVVATLGAEKLGRAVIAHLGNGASMAAVAHGQCVDTTMAFTPTAGLVMGTRTGDLDPGLLVYLLQHKGYDAAKLERLVNHEAGLLGLSGTSSDMQQLLGLRETDARAALAVDVFCMQARKWVGALAAVLGGIDSLVFTGGIGEHAAAVRKDICAGLAHLGVPPQGETGGTCTVHVVHTDEERMIARRTRELTGGAGSGD